MIAVLYLEFSAAGFSKTIRQSVGVSRYRLPVRLREEFGEMIEGNESA
jgi:hypothetical protein